MIEKKVLLVGLFILTAIFTSQAARVDTVMVESQSMQKKVKVVYIVPQQLLEQNVRPCVSVDL